VEKRKGKEKKREKREERKEKKGKRNCFFPNESLLEIFFVVTSLFIIFIFLFFSCFFSFSLFFGNGKRKKRTERRSR
jgi:quinol-cytochrome oxidoreductase complex cytochrome b subunit